MKDSCGGGGVKFTTQACDVRLNLGLLTYKTPCRSLFLTSLCFGKIF